MSTTTTGVDGTTGVGASAHPGFGMDGAGTTGVGDGMPGPDGAGAGTAGVGTAGAGEVPGAGTTGAGVEPGVGTTGAMPASGVAAGATHTTDEVDAASITIMVTTEADGDTTEIMG